MLETQSEWREKENCYRKCYIGRGNFQRPIKPYWNRQERNIFSIRRLMANCDTKHKLKGNVKSEETQWWAFTQC